MINLFIASDFGCWTNIVDHYTGERMIKLKVSQWATLEQNQRFEKEFLLNGKIFKRCLKDVSERNGDKY